MPRGPAAGFSDVPCPLGTCPDPALQALPRFHFDYFVPAMLTVLTTPLSCFDEVLPTTLAFTRETINHY